MKFEKINDNKLKIFISSDELPESETLDELMSDSDIARNEFLAILDEAYNKVGFDTNNYKIKIDAKSSYDGGFVFTVTKIVKLIEKNKKVKPKKIAKKNSTDKIIVYSFNKIDDFFKLCKDFKRNNFVSFEEICSTSDIYKYDNKYFLIVENANQNSDRSGSFFSTITEFGNFVSESKLYALSLKEHGSLIIKNNALSIGQKF